MKKEKDLKKYAIALYETTQGQSGQELDRQVQGFIKLLARKRILSQAPRIIELFIAYYNQAEGIVPVVVGTTHKLGTHELSDLKSHLKQTLGKEVELINEVDDKLIGGMKLRMGDVIIDSTVKNYLNNFKTQLVK